MLVSKAVLPDDLCLQAKLSAISTRRAMPSSVIRTMLLRTSLTQGALVVASGHKQPNGNPNWATSQPQHEQAAHAATDI